MDKIIDKGSLFVLCSILLIGTGSFVVQVLIVLTALIYLSLSLYFTDGRKIMGLMFGFVCICFYQNKLSIFLPLLCYDCISFSLRWGFALAAAGAVPAVWMFQSKELSTWQSALWGFAVIFALFLSARTKRQEQIKMNYIHLRDDSMELKLVMQKRQRELLEKQDYEIRLATLQERNRIAREIHDNVGHMLSRSILQMGALLTIHKEEPVHEQLETVNVTLNEAMNNIRESVHDLHNESLDLRQAILDATKELQSRCQLTVDYDMHSQVPRNVKYCFIAIAKEAVSNIVKHSNATRVSLLLREHPGFYQMSVEDNGTAVQMRNPGIGLSNMTDRVEALGGTIHFFTERGFRILISVPRKQGEEI